MEYEKPKIRSYRDLIVWQKAMQMVLEVYALTKQFPKEELYGLVSQIRRCAVSVPSNIAEGSARISTADYGRCLHIAMGSLYELQTQIELSTRLNYIESKACERFNETTDEIERMLNSLGKKVCEKIKSKDKQY